MRNENTIIQSLWVGPTLGSMEVMCIKSYIQQGHKFHLYVYGPVANVPIGAQLKDANEIIPQNEIFVDAFGGYVNLSNQFRYTLLYKIGGWWVDMDTVCLKPFDFRQDFVFSSETSDPHRRCLVNTTYIKSLPKAKFLKDCLDFMKIRGHANIHWGELGVNLLSRMVFRNGLSEFIKMPVVFCPISPYQVQLFVTPIPIELPKSSYALHWWNEIWRRTGLNKSGNFPTGCLYEQMKIKFIN